MTPNPAIVDHDVTVYLGDVREQLAQLPANIVDTVVTSPPYYGLRDYGTGTWDGGNPDCDHKRSSYDCASTSRLEGATRNCGDGLAGWPGGICGRCGAVRTDHQIGLEPTPAAYVDTLVDVMRHVAHVLRPDGTLWLNLGDSYSTGSGGDGHLTELGQRLGTGGGHQSDASKRARPPQSGMPPKNMLGIPWRVAFAMQQDGWILRNAIVWTKPNAMPESATDRLSNRYEFVYLLTRSRRYRFHLDPIRVPLAGPGDGTPEMQPTNRVMSRRLRTGHRNKPNTAPAPWNPAAAAAGRNPGDVWTIPTTPYPGAHFACMPPALARRCILAGTDTGCVVLDPFTGSGTTLAVARHLGRRAIGVELNPNYLPIIRDRIGQPPFDLDLPTPAILEPAPSDNLDNNPTAWEQPDMFNLNDEATA